MKRTTTLLVASVLGVGLSTLPLAETNAATEARQTNVTVCVVDQCPSSDVVVEACAIGRSVDQAHGRAVAEHAQLCASL